MNYFQNQNILIGISGGIAAYKTAQLVRELKKLGAQVKVVMTESATRFITPLTFQALSGQPVYTGLWEEHVDHGMDHIQLARWADVFLIAPTTANVIAKLANGLADNLLTTIALVTKAPLIICPAMNPSMYEHPATQHNLSILKERGTIIIEPESGEAACGETGLGRMCEIDHLIQVLRLYSIKGLLAGQSCLITAGPTQERIDPVRYISNDSSGKMGYALAYAAWMAGAKVTLVTGPTALKLPPGIKTVFVKSASEMTQAVELNLSQDCIFIGAAAVADYRVAAPQQQKIKKNQASNYTLSLIKNPDILQQVTQSGLAKYVVGFAAETENLINFAHEKRIKKQLNLIIANQVGENIGFNQDEHSVTLLTQDMTLTLPHMHKVRLGAEIIRWIALNMDK